MVRVNLRVPETDLLQWKSRAETAKLSLSDWIRWRCAENKAVQDVPQARNVPATAERESNSRSVTARLRVQIPELTTASELPRRSAVDHLPVLGERVKANSLKKCKHGKAKGFNCWQCSGLAIIESTS